METNNYLVAVKDQYEKLPYPPVNPQDEKKRLQRTWLEDLPMINHYCFQGKQSFQDKFRALVAGGGTGDATIFLAEQLRFTNAEIVHLDLSQASIDIAKARAAVRGLDNIRWVQDSLLNLSGLGLGQFDYINCSGVLHHLADPDAGMHALKSVLKEGGAMGLMLYGTIGRTGVYQMQQLLRLLNVGVRDDLKIAHAKELLGTLRPTCWFKRGEELYTDHNNGDAGIHDLLLHSQDRAYTITEIFEWLADLHGFNIELTDVERGRYPYLPKMTLGQDTAKIRRQLATMPLRSQYAMSELLVGDLITHTFYLTTSCAAKAPYGDADYVPFFFHEPLTGAILAHVFTSNNGLPFPLHHEFLGLTIMVDPGKYASKILCHVDGKKTFHEIFDLLRKDPEFRTSPPDNTTLFADFFESYDTLNAIDRLLLRHSSCLQPESV